MKHELFFVQKKRFANGPETIMHTRAPAPEAVKITDKFLIITIRYFCHVEEKPIFLFSITQPTDWQSQLDANGSDAEPIAAAFLFNQRTGTKMSGFAP